MINSRAIVVIICVLLLFLALVGKLFDIQILKSEELKYYAERQQTRVEKIKAERGLIYDRNNVLLVYNRDDVSFYLDLRMATSKSKQEIADKFSHVFGRTKGYYLNLMAGSKKTICIEKKAPSEKAFFLKDFKVTGLFSREDPTRVYQYDRLASHVLGFIDNEYAGTSGIEKTFQDMLKGEDGTMLVERNAIGDMLTVAEEETKPAVPGENIVLTIDKTYQAILEEELHAGVRTYGALSGTGIIMDPNTGEILALANVDDYDPNSYWQFNDDSRRNKALTDTYEPGSTFKAITMAALFDQNLCRESENIYTEHGKYKFKNVTIYDSHTHDNLTVNGIMEQSSNIGMSKLSCRIDDEIFFKYLRGFGFGNYTSSGLPGEAKGTLKKPNQWTPVTKSFMSYGYEISVTPLQLTAAYCALVNGGILYQPQIVKKGLKNGIVNFENKPKEVRTVISPETSARMRNIMKRVVDNGSGKNAKLDFITVGGKTGTSQKLINNKYSSSSYNSSFVGFFPVEHPKVVCLILMNSPQLGKFGGLVAAPVFKNVASRIVKSDPDTFNNPAFDVKSDLDQIRAAKAEQNDGVEIKNVSDVQTMRKPVIKSKSIMPDLKNTSVRDAILVLNNLGIRYKINGSGRITSQSIEAGSRIKKGLFCTLHCEEIKVNRTAVY
jgi:cell division protein FtsI (penicillin-binding protein 3)